MVRNYRRRFGAEIRRDYPSESVENALRAVVEEGLSFRQAAERFNVPKSTVYRRYRGLHRDTLGRPPALFNVEEKKITDALIFAANCGIPFTESNLRVFIQNYLNRKGVINEAFKNNLPGRDWVKNFLLRQRENLTIRLSENIKRCRATTSTSNGKRTKPPRKQADSDSEENEGIELNSEDGDRALDELEDELSNNEAPVPQTISCSSGESSEKTEPNEENLCKQSFVLVEFIYDKGTNKEKWKKFVARIEDVNDNTGLYTVKCMRGYGQKRDTFVFPLIDDVCHVDKNQIKKLPNPVITRGRHIFAKHISL